MFFVFSSLVYGLVDSEVPLIICLYFSSSLGYSPTQLGSLVHIALSHLVLSLTSSSFNPATSKSSFTHSFHLILGLPPCPPSCQQSPFLSNIACIFPCRKPKQHQPYSSQIPVELTQCTHFFSLSFLTLSVFFSPIHHLKIVISATCILCSCAFFPSIVSMPCNICSFNIATYNFP